VVDVIIHYGCHTHVDLDPTLRKRSTRAMCDSPLVGNYGHLYEYEAFQLTWLLSMEVFRIHGLLEYIESD